MYHQQIKLCLIIPCYNEEKRLDIGEFAKYATDISFVFIDDGSTDGTQKLLKSNIPKNSFFLALDKNCGKAEAVRRGILYAKKEPSLIKIEWFGFWDADLSTPLGEANKMLNFAENFTSCPDAVFASRILRLGSSIKRSFFRHLAGRIFMTVADISLKLGAYDSQCGAKIFHRRAVDKAFSEPFLSKWIFDLEIIMRLKENCKIIEYPLEAWNEVGGSKLMNPKNILRVFMDILRIRKFYPQSRKNK